MPKKQNLRKAILKETPLPISIGKYETGKTRRMMELEILYNTPIRELLADPDGARIARRLGLDTSTISVWKLRLGLRKNASQNNQGVTLSPASSDSGNNQA